MDLHALRPRRLGASADLYVLIFPYMFTPYSMSRLFSEFFRKFGGAFLEVCETISGGSGEVLRGKIKQNHPEKNKIGF